ncbi:MAG: biliverdin-producing heme oxygenase [Steroidobacteraceae bacterium]
MSTFPQSVVHGGRSHRPRAGSLRDALRSRTSDAHSALERTPLMLAFSSGTADRRYASAYLSRQYRLHRDLERALARVLPADFATTRLCRTDWLVEDLDRLGLPLDVRPAPTPRLDSAAAGIGALYVIEGSALGLETVRRRLASAGEPCWALDSRFVRGHGAATAARWREFLHALESLPEAGWPEACVAAERTFDAFHRLFKDDFDE